MRVKLVLIVSLFFTFSCSELEKEQQLSIVRIKNLLEHRYAEDFELLDFNQDGYKDLVFEYYAWCGTSVKLDVYFFNPKLNRFQTNEFSLTNPCYNFNAKTLTSHYWGNGKGWAIKYKLNKGVFIEIENYSFSINTKNEKTNNVYGLRNSYSKYPFEDTITWVDTTVINDIANLPEEYHHERIIQ